MTKTHIEKLLEQRQELTTFYNEQKKIFNEKVRSCIERQNEIDKLCWKYFIDNKLYCPIEDLNRYKGKEIEEITLVFDDGATRCYSYGDILEIDKDGHFDYSDEFGGFIQYDQNKQKYIKCYYGVATELNIVGFYDLSLEQDGKVVETQYKELLCQKKCEQA